jgi:DNA invertase Pin-like site-specific DNA recombinase
MVSLIHILKGEMNMTIYGYARVSTLHQDLEVQIQALKQEGCQEIFEEKFTGTKVDRPEFNKLLNKLKKDDKLIITKLDRLARNTKEGIQIIEELFKKNVKVHVLNVGLLEDTTMGNFFLQTLLAVAEMEWNEIIVVERTQEGKAIAKQRDDFREGRPNKFTKKQIEHALQLLESHSYKQVEELTGISKSTLIRAKKRNER